MAKAPVEITTQLSMAEAADVFRSAMRVSWWSEHITGAGTTFEEPTGSVFDSVAEDRPDFAVMALLGGRGAQIQKSAVHMYMWNRGGHREIMLGVGRNLAAFGIKANRKIRRYVDALAEADPSLEYSGI
ncbi:hypothetical protein OG739_32160 [Streptomyces longwoodensis]|uniref:hypothetical protein n=1 Tax=Streptomyces longwoodensis TaxID=68231 RepID=UPI00225B55B6|nr:hypothetical protein [Streptomyces longwoodensis]MCX4997354.1 hypothetical protein [Streptomyces longwoodensis]WRY91984.1 hypothetical protein OG481_27305 [Streptomyces longwoodensis]WUC56497.1 hypothetical protein OHA09_05040 [Streptomyces longwoodensis]WUC70027.1 hypothetical protein OG416_04025 [Streptomyces longwoodensis]